MVLLWMVVKREWRARCSCDGGSSAARHALSPWHEVDEAEMLWRGDVCTCQRNLGLQACNMSRCDRRGACSMHVTCNVIECPNNGSNVVVGGCRLHGVIDGCQGCLSFAGPP